MAWTTISPKITPLNQPTSSTCWYSCLQMLFIWKGLDPADVYRRLEADPEIFPDYWLQKGVAPYNCIQIARCLGLTGAGEGDADADVLANALTTHGPYWVAGEWKKGSSHVKVVTGVNPSSGKIRLVDPWMNHDLSESEDLLVNFNDRGKVWENTFGSFLYWGKAV